MSKKSYQLRIRHLGPVCAPLATFFPDGGCRRRASVPGPFYVFNWNSSYPSSILPPRISKRVVLGTVRLTNSAQVLMGPALLAVDTLQHSVFGVANVLKLVRWASCLVSWHAHQLNGGTTSNCQDATEKDMPERH
jgi:hypothetical protein